MKKILLFVVVVWAGWGSQAQENQDYKAAMVKMLEVSKSMDAMKQLAPQMRELIKQQMPDAPEAFWKEYEEAMIAMYDRILKEMTPIYQKYLTLEDIQQIIAFYESPVGQKLAGSNTKIAMETVPLAQKIAAETLQPLMENAKAKGYLR